MEWRLLLVPDGISGGWKGADAILLAAAFFDSQTDRSHASALDHPNLGLEVVGRDARRLGELRGVLSRPNREGTTSAAGKRGM